MADSSNNINLTPVPVDVQISTKAESTPAWEKAGTLAESLAWPVVLLVLLLVYRAQIIKVLEILASRTSEISIGWAKIQFPTVERLSIPSQDVTDFQKGPSGHLIYESGKRSLIKLFRTSKRPEYIIVDLGGGQEWLSSRLYILALMLQRMTSTKCIVFIASAGERGNAFRGISTPEKIRWAIARAEPWHECAFAHAYNAILNNAFSQMNAQVAGVPAAGAPVAGVQATTISIRDDEGALDVATAETLVKEYLKLVTQAPQPPTSEWTYVNNSYEHASWVTEEYIDLHLASSILTDEIVDGTDLSVQVAKLVESKSPYVAKIGPNGDFLSLINRVSWLEKIAYRASIAQN